MRTNDSEKKGIRETRFSRMITELGEQRRGMLTVSMT